MKNNLYLLCLTLLIALFSYTAAAKWLDLHSFFFDIHNQRIPEPLVIPAALLLVSLETLIPVFLLFDRLQLSGLFIALALFIIFTIYSVLILAHTFAQTPCSCGGILKGLTWPQHFAMNLTYLFITGWVIFYKTSKLTIKNIHA